MLARSTGEELIWPQLAHHGICWGRGAALTELLALRRAYTVLSVSKGLDLQSAGEHQPELALSVRAI